MARRNVHSYGPKEKVLLVEGDDDKHFFWNLLEAHGITEGVRVEDMGGYTRVRESLSERLRIGAQTHLGVVVDADQDPQSRWASLRDVLRSAGYIDVPDVMQAGGTIVGLVEPQPPVGAEPQYKTIVGVWVMPDNTAPGALEEFAQTLLPPTDTLWSRAAQCVASIPDDERLFGLTDVTKATLHTWLAWQETPGYPIGRAVKVNALRHHAEPAQSLIEWLEMLFGLGISSNAPPA